MAEGAGGTATGSMQSSNSSGQAGEEGSSADIWVLKFSYDYSTTHTASTSDDVNIVLGTSQTRKPSNP